MERNGEARPRFLFAATSSLLGNQTRRPAGKFPAPAVGGGKGWRPQSAARCFLVSDWTLQTMPIRPMDLPMDSSLPKIS